MKMILEDKGIICKEFNLHLLLEPWIIKRRITLNIRCLRLYNAFQKQVIPKPISRVQSIKWKLFTSKLYLSQNYTCCRLYRGHLIWKQYGSLQRKGHTKHLRNFSSKLASYSEGRDFPNQNAHSMLAPYLSFGQISVKLMYHYLINKSTERQCSFENK